MAGATKCYKARLVGGEVQRLYVEHSPKYADAPLDAVRKMHAGGWAIVAPPKWAEVLDLLHEVDMGRVKL